jgi:adenosine deaminase
VRVTINSDDPAYFPGYVGDNLETFAEAVALTAAEAIQLQRNAIEIAWLSDADKATMLADLEART